MNKQQKIKLTFLLVLLFLSLYLEWFSSPDHSIVLKGTELLNMSMYLVGFLIVGVISVWIDVKSIHALGLLSLGMFMSIQLYEFFNWYVNLFETSTLSLSSLDLAQFGFYISAFMVILCFFVYLQYFMNY